ncbi:hypothetical protein ILUMI_10216 [Ignelater luminosus]|uniref:Uncharacterized protein n=1 Tax=Ignelater luminosus TaxID=2038154 RepID=A0A8K0D3N8_IGNLU|nr:hypothetical protein ILUMI_10216 [Ignelater luminosus]
MTQIFKFHEWVDCISLENINNLEIVEIEECLVEIKTLYQSFKELCLYNETNDQSDILEQLEQGPPLLKPEESQWPILPINNLDELPELKVQNCVSAHSSGPIAVLAYPIETPESKCVDMKEYWKEQGLLKANGEIDWDKMHDFILEGVQEGKSKQEAEAIVKRLMDACHNVHGDSLRQIVLNDNESDIFATEDSFGESDNDSENKEWLENSYVQPVFAGTSSDRPFGISNTVKINMHRPLSCFEVQSRKRFPKDELRSDRSLKKGDSDSVMRGIVGISKWKDRGTKSVGVTMHNAADTTFVLRTDKSS